MSITIPPFGRARSGRPEDDVDALLHDFFRAETPRPWPKPPTVVGGHQPARNGHVKLPFAATPSQQERQPWKLSSRLALAASLGGLLLGTWLLSGQFKGNQKLDDANLGAPSGNVKFKEELVQPPDGPTRLRFEFNDPTTNMIDPF